MVRDSSEHPDYALLHYNTYTNISYHKKNATAQRDPRTPPETQRKATYMAQREQNVHQIHYHRYEKVKRKLKFIYHAQK